MTEEERISDPGRCHDHDSFESTTGRLQEWQDRLLGGRPGRQGYLAALA